MRIDEISHIRKVMDAQNHHLILTASLFFLSFVSFIFISLLLPNILTCGIQERKNEILINCTLSVWWPLQKKKKTKIHTKFCMMSTPFCIITKKINVLYCNDISHRWRRLNVFLSTTLCTKQKVSCVVKLIYVTIHCWKLISSLTTEF